MRRVAAFLCVAAAALILGGCGTIAVEQHLTVKPNGRAELVNTLLFPEALADWAEREDPDFFDLRQIEQSVREEFPGRPVRVERVEDGGREGVRVTIRFDRIEDVRDVFTSPQQQEVAPGHTVTISPLFSELTIRREPGWLGDRYTFYAKMDTSLVESAVRDAYRTAPPDADWKALGFDVEEFVRTAMAMFEYRFAVTLPGRIDPETVGGPSEPAISDDGRTVTWTIPHTQAVTLQAASKTGLLAGFSLPNWGGRIKALWDNGRLEAVFEAEWALPVMAGVAAGAAAALVTWRLGWWRE
ncbi:MAG: hypothetical protein DIU76_02700 [Bacillota bacterium]|nr:MAG: hypothetical protein DIU76_02700 [Bacillota bacterium]